MHFDRTKRLSTVNNVNIFCHLNMINQANSYMYLGNNINSNLKLNENFDKKYKKASGRMRLLTKVRPYLNQAAAFEIFNMMIVALLTYCSIINLNCTLTHKRLI